MKKPILLIRLILTIIISANAQKKTFFQVYNLAGKKIASGFFACTTNSTLLLSKTGSC